MGTNDKEGLVRKRKVKPFYIDKITVTNKNSVFLITGTRIYHL